MPSLIQAGGRAIVVFSKIFGGRVQHTEDAFHQQVMTGIFRAAIGDLGPASSMSLTLYCVCVIAGHAIQQVTLAKRIASGLPHRAPEVVAVTTSSGANYVFGDAIAHALMRSGDQAGFIELMADQAKIPFP